MIGVQRIVLTQMPAAVCEHPGRPVVGDGIRPSAGLPPMSGRAITHDGAGPAVPWVQTVSEGRPHSLPGKAPEAHDEGRTGWPRWSGSDDWMSWCQGRRGCLRHEGLSRDRSWPPSACAEHANL
jgi:hypothetical protein